MNIIRKAKHIKRLADISKVILKHGLGPLLHQLNITHFFFEKDEAVKATEHSDSDLTVWGQKLALVFEELGPVFIKLGQVLAVRHDILPYDFVSGLNRLQDKVAPFDSKEAFAIIEKDLGPISDIFSSITEEPIAAASLAQIHKGVLLDGTPVAIKVQRPNLKSLINTDIEILYSLAEFLTKHVPDGEIYLLNDFVEHFETHLSREIDFLWEKRNLQRFYTIYKDNKTIHAPYCFDKLSTKNVLTMEFIDGVNINDVEALREQHFDPVRISAKFTEAMMSQVIDERIYHADPHPGNILIQPDESMVFLDFGQVNTMTETMVNQFIDIALALEEKDAGAMADILWDLCQNRSNSRRDILEQDISLLLAHFENIFEHQVEFITFSNQVFQIIRKNKLVLSPDFLWFNKLLVIIDGIGRQLDPDYNGFITSIKLIKEHVAKRMTLPAIFRIFKSDIVNTFRFARSLPSTFRKLNSQLFDQNFRLRVNMAMDESYQEQAKLLRKSILSGLVFIGFVIALGIFCVLPLFYPFKVALAFLAAVVLLAVLTLRR